MMAFAYHVSRDTDDAAGEETGTNDALEVLTTLSSSQASIFNIWTSKRCTLVVSQKLIKPDG
jgi:hypothetical protein